jgi:hypothetical protein
VKVCAAAKYGSPATSRLRFGVWWLARLRAAAGDRNEGLKAEGLFEPFIVRPLPAQHSYLLILGPASVKCRSFS